MRVRCRGHSLPKWNGLRTTCLPDAAVDLRLPVGLAGAIATTQPDRAGLAIGRSGLGEAK